MGDKASAPDTCRAMQDQPLALIEIGAKSQDQAYKSFPVLWQAIVWDRVVLYRKRQCAQLARQSVFGRPGHDFSVIGKADNPSRADLRSGCQKGC